MVFGLLGLHIVVAVAAFIVTFFFSGHYLPEKMPSGSHGMVLIGNAMAPAFIGYRVTTASRDSAVFVISLITTAITGLLLYYYVICQCGSQLNFYLFLTNVVYCLSAFICIFPKWTREP